MRELTRPVCAFGCALIGLVHVDGHGGDHVHVHGYGYGYGHAHANDL
jgi:hypothetical protein